MLRSWRESSRALAALAASLSVISSLVAAEPALLWQSSAEQESVVMQAQCINGMCPRYYGSPEVIPGPVYSNPPPCDFIVEQPACDVMCSQPCDVPTCCDSVASDCCTDCCANCCCPLWTIRGEALFLSRTGGGGVPLVGAPIAVNSSDFDMGVAVGPRITLIRHGLWGTAWDGEIAYFGINGWNDTIVLADIDNYLTTPTINIGGVIPGTLTYDSRLLSAEANLRRGYNEWVTWLVGFRWVEVGENLNADFGGAASHNVAVNNALFGGQIGADALLWDNGANFNVNGVIKAGVFGNTADQVTTTTGVGGALPLITASTGQASFLGEVGFNARYRWSDRLNLVGGYNLIWITGVALAPNQLATTDITTGVATVDAGGTLFYHGANAGLEYSW